jgi:hypothetical protein
MSFVDDLLKARWQADTLDEELYDKVCEIFKEHGEYPVENVNVDPSDWDGLAIEMDGAKEGIVPTPEQIQSFWDLGFTVIRIDYAGRKERSFAGDWWLVKGFDQPFDCDHKRHEVRQ